MEELLEQINAQDADADADATATLPAIASLRRWLQSAFLSVKNAPIFLIGSRGDIVNKRTDHERISQCLSKHFGLSPFWPAIVETDDSLNFWPVDNTRSGRGSGSGGADPVVASLRVAIDKAARAQAHARCKLPLRWISLLDWLHAKGYGGGEEEGEKEGEGEGGSEERKVGHISMAELVEKARSLGMPSRDLTLQVR